MSGALSKRQQARNERTLQELIKSVPGNNVCADCQARNPGWASWSLGIFLCMRCAALHRKLGTHITKVKSLSMDSWSNEQVENMKRVGNVASNGIYNPQNTRPPVPFDADEADSAMERFIRQKYQDRAVKPPTRHNTGSTNSDDQPPPLPPKTGNRFGFRSASSIFPLSSKSRRQAAQNEFEQRARSPSPERGNKQSRVFGASAGSDEPEDLDQKLAKLRDMGFRDEKRNVTVLKGLQGNLEKSIETLIRLGEGSRSAGLAKPDSGPSSRSRTPISPAAGLTIGRTRETEFPKHSNNPFDALDLPRTPAPPQSSQSTGSMAQPQMMGNNPYQPTQNSNPFGLMPSQSQYSLNQAFQNMAVSSSQPLFPNHTGGIPAPQQQSQVQQLYQQSMTPPVPSIPQQYYPPVIYENPAQQPQQNHNPFMQQQQQVPPINTNFQSNPYAQQLSAPPAQTKNFFNSPIEQSPMQQQGGQAFYDNGFQQHLQQQQQQVQQSNPFFQNSGQQAPQQQMPQQAPQQVPQQVSQQLYNFQGQQHPQFQQYRQQTFPLMPQQTDRADKRSILDLYNYPQLAPTPLQQQQKESEIQIATAAPTDAQQQRSISSPVFAPMAGSRNPFMNSAGSGVQSPAGDSGAMGQFVPAQNGARHVSQESMSVDVGGWNGRHSPDAWGTISSRSVR